MHEAQDEHGLIRTRSVAPPPTPDGKIRIVEIVGLDRQACGGTHLASTGDRRRSASSRSTTRAGTIGACGSGSGLIGLWPEKP